MANMDYAEEVFEQAWNNPEYTQMKLDDVNINETLSRYYETPTPVNFTRQMLWDIESKKAWDPHVVTLFFSASTTEGSARVERSPRFSLSFTASLRRILRIILPERVLGKAFAKCTSSGTAIALIW